jgi:hypothetical protein
MLEIPSLEISPFLVPALIDLGIAEFVQEINSGQDFSFFGADTSWKARGFSLPVVETIPFMIELRFKGKKVLIILEIKLSYAIFLRIRISQCGYCERD